MHGVALEEGDEDAGGAEGECDEVHGVDGEARVRVDGEGGVEEEEGVFDGPVAGEVEEAGGHGELGGVRGCALTDWGVLEYLQ